MCAIVDANVVGELWEYGSSEAGKGFRRWVDESNGRLIMGGKLRRELNSTRAAKWILELKRKGRLISFDDGEVDQLAKTLESYTSKDLLYCRSNDHHIIALAKISGARLLYSNDKDLQKDFKNADLINKPRGVVFSTREPRTFDKQHKTLLGRQKCHLHS